ncbi:MAG: hypothetical protein K2O23_02805, partial [Anaeroplasmataceae bacterium]|nr:hypothetical protein [Anaeroplasmataceae bacterium]
MKKKKQIETIELDEKFTIPQISYTLEGLLKGKSKFQPSQIVSPVHGTHIVDRIHYVDNSGKVNVDYGYDYIRDKKHISDEELIAKHGTKYYEFSYVNKQLTEEEKRGTDYSKKEEKPKPEPVKENKTLSSFFTTEDELKIEEEEAAPILDPVVEETPEEPTNPFEEDAEFKIHISVEEDNEPFEYNTYDNNLPKPEPTPIHNYDYRREDLIPPKSKPTPPEPKPTNTFKPIYDTEEKIEDIVYNDEEDIVELPEEEIAPQEVVEEAPVYTRPVSTPKEEPKPAPAKPKYDDYKIPYKSLFPVSDAALEEMPAWLEEKKEIINQQLQAFGIDGEVITYTKGPAFTRYEIMLAQNVNVKKINSIYDNIQMALKAKSMRIQAPIPGKNTVGIEVPNDKAD